MSSFPRPPSVQADRASAIDHNSVLTIIQKRLVETHFQPIVSSQQASIVAYEALTRGPSDSRLHAPTQLFAEARQQGCLSALEHICREAALARFQQLQLPGQLFLNVSPDVILQEDHQPGQTLALIQRYGLRPEQVVIELTEQGPVHDVALMRQAMAHYKRMGFAIALDDLGAGYSSLRLWSELSPAYVKIDRHFVQYIDQDRVKRDFVRFIVEIARAVGSQVVAEGIETEAEYLELKGLGVDLLQGYYFGRPARDPIRQIGVPLASHMPANASIYGDCDTALHLCRHVTPMPPEALTGEALQRFVDNPELFSIPVVDAAGQAQGLLLRNKLLTQLTRPYGQELHSRKPVSKMMNSTPLLVAHDLKLEQVSQWVTTRPRAHLEDDFILTKEGQYLGVGQVIDLLRAITDLQVRYAQQANPLTLLPGNGPIQATLDQWLSADEDFIAAYLDLDNFKAFNDTYGYAKGDQLLMVLARLLPRYFQTGEDFVGHIGGDDFVVVCRHPQWLQCMTALLQAFDQEVAQLYSPEDRAAGGIMAQDRYGAERFFPMVSVSVAVLDSRYLSNRSAHALSADLAHLKHEAKKQPGSCVVLQRDQQLECLWCSQSQSCS
ncbi:hypothetical protein BFW38_01910 [Terasakiispira papahanaumokuakeensis]|uniref:Diguanylate phosphodiesterase n=1 Tax=Terasakiispira papahanaumokuakeensis TaxID=197479 RepID=A0A1E2V6E5_9GAMM|nr:GGDEF domain-containing protein [Terasakiispira papahanaumokuakeensis]ODC02483.1 hypothetical protein BFW38_01910 [Terasakiispira papahanaumokuakeensis]